MLAHAADDLASLGLPQAGALPIPAPEMEIEEVVPVGVTRWGMWGSCFGENPPIRQVYYKKYKPLLWAGFSLRPPTYIPIASRRQRILRAKIPRWYKYS